MKRSLRRAVTKLDQRVPGWDTRIDLGKLTMASMDQCILGQVFAEKAYEYGYPDGYSFACLTGQTQRMPFFIFCPFTPWGHRRVIRAWTELIEMRRVERFVNSLSVEDDSVLVDA